LWTDWILEEELRGTRPKRLILICPADGDHWTFAALAVLLNEKSHERSLDDGPRFYIEANGNSYFSFSFRRSGTLEPVAFLIKLYPQRKGHFRLQLRQKENGCVRIPGGAWRECKWLNSAEEGKPTRKKS
jgi:hypothetical protein